MSTPTNPVFFFGIITIFLCKVLRVVNCVNTDKSCFFFWDAIRQLAAKFVRLLLMSRSLMYRVLLSCFVFFVNKREES